MKRALRSQWLNLTLVIGALAAVIAVAVTSGRVTTGEREARSANVLSAFREDDITRLILTGKGKRWVLEREASGDAGDSTWYLREPVQEAADAYAVDKLLGSLEFARWVRRIDEKDVDRQRFGLESPA